MIFRNPKLTVCLSAKRLYAGGIWAQFWGEKGVGNVPVNMVGKKSTGME